ncbi:MAG TPA: TadE/TadG family type IV pilus assembly protein, partial [Afifellaceae bacterium]|nr:TadE/TadG family type IV pilus assembly protein [Afifellaceae bacterium]
RRDDKGVAAMEFGLVAPILFFGLLSAIDLGLAVNERMDVNHVLRAGAEAAINKADPTDVLEVMAATGGQNMTVSTNGQGGAGDLSVTVNQYCACPDATEVAVTCSTICTGNVPTYVYYQIDGSKTYTGMFIPNISFTPSIRVQIR